MLDVQFVNDGSEFSRTFSEVFIRPSADGVMHIDTFCRMFSESDVLIEDGQKDASGIFQNIANFIGVSKREVSDVDRFEDLLINTEKNHPICIALYATELNENCIAVIDSLMRILAIRNVNGMSKMCVLLLI